jgi:hypothetical protein
MAPPASGVEEAICDFKLDGMLPLFPAGTVCGRAEL